MNEFEQGDGILMIKVGFIGYGSMGSMLVRSLIRSGRIMAEEMIVSTRTQSKLSEIKGLWENIQITGDKGEVARNAKYIFLCVKPLQVKVVLLDIKPYISPDTNIISIAGTVPMKFIEQVTGARVTKLTPSLTSEAMDGISLVCHSSTVSREERQYIETLLGGISTVKRIHEDDLELAAELTSCMPGFIAAVFKNFAESGARQKGGLSKEDVEEMIIKTLSGTAKLFVEKNMGFDQMVERVATKGGITEEGVKVFNARLPGVFDEMFQKTMAKRRLVKEKVESGLKLE